MWREREADLFSQVSSRKKISSISTLITPFTKKYLRHGLNSHQAAKTNEVIDTSSHQICLNSEIRIDKKNRFSTAHGPIRA